MSRRTSRWVGATALAVSLGGPGGMSGAFADEPTVIRSVPIGNLRILDPSWTTAYITRNHAYPVWDTLFARDANGEIQPQMVDSWTVSDDGLTYTFTLRDGPLWRDGEPVRAVDCVASIRRWAARDGMGQALMGFTESLDVVDDRIFTPQLTRPIGVVLDALGKIDGNVPFMLPERLALTPPTEQITEVIGSGPFRFVAEEWVPGDRVESVYLPDAGVAMSAIVGGEIDLHEFPPADLVSMVEGTPGIDVLPKDPQGYKIFMALDHLHPPFDDRRVREALLRAIDQETFLASIVRDAELRQPCVAVFGCGGPNESDAGAEPLARVDPDRARALLEEAGALGAPVVVLDPADHATYHPLALMAAQTLRQIGFDVTLEAMDWSTLLQRRHSRAAPEDGGWNLFITGTTVVGIANPSSHNFVKHCEQAWYGWPCDQRVVELTAAWAVEDDEAARLRMMQALQRLHMENVSFVPLGQYRLALVHRQEITDVIPSPALFDWNLKKEG